MKTPQLDPVSAATPGAVWRFTSLQLTLLAMSSRKTRLASEKHLKNVTRRGLVSDADTKTSISTTIEPRSDGSQELCWCGTTAASVLGLGCQLCLSY